MKTFTLLFALVLLTLTNAMADPLTIDKNKSSIEVAVKATMDSFTAKLSDYDASISTTPGSTDISSAQVRFRFADVKTGKDKRDAEMHRWQDTEKFPDCIYVMEKLTPAGGENYTAEGSFTLHGITKQLSFPVSIRLLPDGTYKLDSGFTLNTQDFGMPVFKKFAVLKVDPLLRVAFHLEGKSTSAAQ